MPDYPPLVMAITFGVAQGKKKIDASLLELLLEKGADANFTDNEGKTPLTLAIEKGLPEVEKLLLQYGAKMPEKRKPCLKIDCEHCATKNYFYEPCDPRRLFPYEDGTEPYFCEHCRTAMT
jgi:hypothetical protein